MASKRTLNAKNLEVLGTERLAELLMEVSKDRAGLKRQLRHEILAAVSPKAAFGSLLKRLKAIQGHVSKLSAEKTDELADELNSYRIIVLTKLLHYDPDRALQVMLTLVSLAVPLEDRARDYSGGLELTLLRAANELADIADEVEPDPLKIASDVFSAGLHDKIAIMSVVLESLEPLLEEDGLLELRKLYLQRKMDAESLLAENSHGKYTARLSLATSRKALRLIADGLDDVDGFAEQFSEKDRRNADVSAAIANRLLDAGRPQEALVLLDSAVRDKHGRFGNNWMESRISVLEAIGRTEEAQNARWTRFEKTPQPSVLRAILRRLPEDQYLLAEQRAVKHIESFRPLVDAVEFLISWGADSKAAMLIVQREAELAELEYEHLVRIIDMVSEDYPLASILLNRQHLSELVDFSRSGSWYRAAQVLQKCRVLAKNISDWKSVPSQSDFEEMLRKKYRYKYRFWEYIDEVNSKS